MKRSLAAIVFIWVGAPAAAQDAACSTRATQIERNTCASDDFHAAERELTKLLGEAGALARKADKGDDLARMWRHLRSAQRGWTLYRGRHCELTTAHARGSATEPQLVSSCLAEKTRERARELRLFLDSASQ